MTIKNEAIKKKTPPIQTHVKPIEKGRLTIMYRFLAAPSSLIPT